MTTILEDFLNELHALEERHKPIPGICSFCDQPTIDPQETACNNCIQENYAE